MKYERLTTRIMGYAHGRSGETIEIALKNNKQVYRGKFECTGLVDRLAELEDKIENGTLVDIEITRKYIELHRTDNKWYVYETSFEPTDVCIGVCDTKEAAEARLKELRGDK